MRGDDSDMKVCAHHAQMMKRGHFHALWRDYHAKRAEE